MTPLEEENRGEQRRTLLGEQRKREERRGEESREEKRREERRNFKAILYMG